MSSAIARQRVEKQLHLPQDALKKIVRNAADSTKSLDQQVEAIQNLARFLFEHGSRDVGAHLIALIDTKRDAAFISSLLGKIQYKAELAPDFLDEPRLKNDLGLASHVFARAMKEAVTFDKYIFLNTLLNHEIRRSVCSNPLDQKIKQAFLDALKICLAVPKHRCLAILKADAEPELRSLFSDEQISRELLSSKPTCRNRLIDLLQCLQKKAPFRTERGTPFKYALGQTEREASCFERIPEEEKEPLSSLACESTTSPRWDRKLSVSSYVDPQDYNQEALRIVKMLPSQLVLPIEAESAPQESELNFTASPDEDEKDPKPVGTLPSQQALADEAGSVSRVSSLEPDHIGVRLYKELFSLEPESPI